MSKSDIDPIYYTIVKILIREINMSILVNHQQYSQAIKNSIISLIMGDMMGTPVQFILRKNLQKSLKDEPISSLILKTKSNIPFGSWSDDSSMTLCTMESIAEKSNIDLKNLVEYFCKWLYKGYMTPFNKTFDVGMTTMEGLNRYIRTDKTVMDIVAPNGSTNIRSNGNGSLMRILPVSIYCYFRKLSSKETFKIIDNVSSLTHAHAISVLGCYIYTLIVFDILDGKSKNEIIENLKNIYNNEAIPDEYRVWLDEYSEIINGNIIKENAENIDSSGYVKSTLGVAIWGFYNNKSVEDCIFRIIELGHDSDTNGAVGAGLSGLYYGLRGNLAQDYWVNKIIKKDMINTVIEKYIEILNV